MSGALENQQRFYGPAPSNSGTDVLIIGAGPAGSSAAIAAAQLGLRVTLVDAKAFPRRKACGGCLNQVSTALLKKLLGESHGLWRSSMPLDQFQLQHRQRQFRFAVPGGMAVERAELDDALVQRAVQLGVQFRPQVQAKLLERVVERTVVEGRAVELRSAPSVDSPREAAQSPADLAANSKTSTETVVAKVVVVAAGLANHATSAEPSLRQHSSLTSRVGIEAIYENFHPHYRDQTIHMVLAAEGYVGLTQIHGGRLHVAAAVDRDALKRGGPEELTQQILRSAGAPAMLADRQASWRGTPRLTSRAKNLAAERVFLIGDAAGYVEPFTGEGIRWAVETGVGVAPLLARAVVQWQPALIDEYQRWYRRKIEPEQRLCRRLTSGLKSAPARGLAHLALRMRPQIAESIIRRLNTETHA